MLHTWKVRIFDENWRIERDPRVLVVESPDHFAVFRPVRKSNGRAVHCDKTLAVVVDKRKKRGFLFGIHFQLAARVEKYGVKIVQVFGVVLQLSPGQRFRVGSNRGNPQAGFTA